MSVALDNLLYKSGLTAQGCWDSMDDYDREAIMKFAELIVKECMELTHWKEFDMSREQRIRLSVYQDIKEHFGVEQ